MQRHRIGLISDTHGLLRPEALVALRDSDRIIHAGDVGDPSILERLGAIAPVTAVRGNNDRDHWAERLPHTARLHVGAVAILVIHDVAELAADAHAERVDVVVAGHSHRPICERRDGVLYVNPGSAGPRRFSLPVSVAKLSVVGTRVHGRLVTLNVAAAAQSARR